MVNVKGPLIDESINVKICDLGNGCWTHYHFVPKIQTRQYRAPEVIMGVDMIPAPTCGASPAWCSS